MATKKLTPRDGNFLFDLRVDLGRYGQPRKLATIRAFDRNERCPVHGHNYLRLELRFEGRTLWTDGRVGLPAGTCVDGVEARELALSLFAMKPGDTDREFFSDYTEEQLEFVSTYGEEIGLIREDRYCDPETGAVRK